MCYYVPRHTARSKEVLDPKKYFPKNVWFRTANGFVSRPVTMADQARREAYLVDFLFRRIEREQPTEVCDLS